MRPSIATMLGLVGTLTVCGNAGAQEPEEPAVLSDEAAAAAEAAAIEELSLVSPDGEKTVEQLWQLAQALTKRRAYCKAVDYLLQIEEADGAISENTASAAQTFYVCARTRLSQGDAELASSHLQRSIKIVGERPEHRDLLFKLALVGAKAAMKTEDLAKIREQLEEAKRYGVDSGPGANGRLADWALPVIQDAVMQISMWSHALKEEGRTDLAREVSALALEYNPRDKMAAQVQRELALGGGLPQAVAIGGGLLLALGFLWRILRHLKMKKVAGGMADFDDLDDDDDLDA